MEIIGFFIGILLVYSKQAYLCLLLLAVFVFRPLLRWILWFLAGACWALFHQWWVVDVHMPKVSLIKHASLEGYIASVPKYKGSSVQFQFDLKTLNHQPVQSRLLLTCYDHCPNLHAGQYWRLHATIKRPKNLENPGCFDYAGHLHARHIDWTGYVYRNGFQARIAKSGAYRLLRLREYLGHVLQTMQPDLKVLGVIQALTLGLTQHIDSKTWDLFRHTGTTHLMVISGAHVGLVAGMVYWLIKWLWSRSSVLCLWIASQRVASLVALLAVLTYGVLAGLGVPVQRALIVCFFMLLRYSGFQRFSAWQAWRYALLSVLILEPHSVWLPGFYLSFIAVAILLSVNQCMGGRGIKKTLALQGACLVGLMPLTLYWFSYGAVSGFFANLVAIPFVGFVIIPMALISLVLSVVWSLPGLMTLLKHAIDLLLYFLHWMTGFDAINLHFSLKSSHSAALIMLALVLLYFFKLNRLLPAILSLGLGGFFPMQESIAEGEAKVDVLDVGQGLSVLVRTHRHVLLYDTGVRFYRGTDMGKLAIMPYLDKIGVKRLDKVVISHSDLDHRGGLPTLEANYKINELIVDDPSYYRRGVSCHDYAHWEWDGISFRFFPIQKPLKGKNNHSCVLQIANARHQMLLTGDIEAAAERYLIKTYKKALASSAMLVPHHGSKTSSTPAFIRQVSPSYGIMSYGLNNRYHFPHVKTMAAYEAEKVALYHTASCGMTSILLTQQPSLKPTCYLK